MLPLSTSALKHRGGDGMLWSVLNKSMSCFIGSAFFPSNAAFFRGLHSLIKDVIPRFIDYYTRPKIHFLQRNNNDMRILQHPCHSFPLKRFHRI